MSATENCMKIKEMEPTEEERASLAILRSATVKKTAQILKIRKT